MDQTSAINLVKETFNYPFDEEKFSKFTINLLDKINKPTNQTWQSSKSLPSEIKDKVVEFKIFGNLEYDNGEKIVVATARLKSAKIVEKSRFIQRDFAKWLMNNYETDACLISFFAENHDDWRFSLVCTDYDREISDKGKIKVKQTTSPIKRYSYLVGKNEPNNTAKSQLAPLLYCKEKITIEALEKAFSLEKVTKEFFNQYKRLCFKIADELKALRKKDENINKDFKIHFLKEVDFAKKFMGQIIFLYFIQKKGWIGIKRDKNGFFTKWGSGPKNFLRRLFNKEYCSYKNFFNDILEDLFYIGLSVDLPDNFYSKLECKVPFLNGGLFEPINDYNWKETDITIENTTIKEILEVFDTFNFTVNEEDPLEKEIAIDPETLGKVFENLLDENLQRGQGVFYTPRNIVNYMCESAVASHLKNNLNQNYNYLDCKKYINEIILTDIETEQSIEKLNKDTLLFLKENSERIENSLKNIRICDPAVGSGAFPVSMMNMIVKIRRTIKLFYNQVDSNLNYKLKYHFIKKSIYGVDIDKSAVEITKLRLWLSLTIDEENYEKINTLPNLDYKILQGNSLFDDFGGNFGLKESKSQYSFDNLLSEKESLIELYFEKIKDYDLLTNQNKKKNEREKINEILRKIILSEIQSVKSFDKKNPLIEHLSKNLDSLDKKINDFFCWNIIFHKIFKNNGGFDIILANPPYLRQEEIIKYKERLKGKYQLFNSTSDLYTYFFELSYNLLKNNGTLVFITSNKWMRAKYGKLLRTFFKNEIFLNEIMNFSDLKIFENAITNTNISVLNKFKSTNEEIFYTQFSKGENVNNIYKFFINNNIPYNKNKLDTENFTFLNKYEEKLKNKLVSKGKPLKELDYKIYRGIKTGFNDAFVINSSIRENILKESPKSKYFLKPILRGRDIGQYKYNFNKLWMITIPSGWTNKQCKPFDAERFMNKNYSAILNHLEKIDKGRKKLNKSNRRAKGLKQREDQGDYWWELRDCDYYELYKEKKIIWIELSDKNKFTICKDNYYILAGGFMLIGQDLEFLNAYLNSKIALFLFNLICNSSGMSTNQWMKFALEKLSVPQNFKKSQKTEIDLIVNKIYKNVNQDNIEILVKKIDKIFYDYFDLNDKEISLIENKF